MSLLYSHLKSRRKIYVTPREDKYIRKDWVRIRSTVLSEKDRKLLEKQRYGDMSIKDDFELFGKFTFGYRDGLVYTKQKTYPAKIATEVKDKHEDESYYIWIQIHKSRMSEFIKLDKLYKYELVNQRNVYIFEEMENKINKIDINETNFQQLYQTEEEIRKSFVCLITSSLNETDLINMDTFSVDGKWIKHLFGFDKFMEGLKRLKQGDIIYLINFGESGRGIVSYYKITKLKDNKYERKYRFL